MFHKKDAFKNLQENLQEKTTNGLLLDKVACWRLANY